MPKFRYVLAGPLFLLTCLACNPGAKESFKDHKDQSTSEKDESIIEDDDQIPKQATTTAIDELEEAPPAIPIVTAAPDLRPIETRLCEDGPKLFNLVEKPNLGQTFSLVCDGGVPTPLYRSLITSAFEGSGTPAVKLVSYEVGALFVTKLVVGFALKIPLNEPSKFYELKAHDILASGIQLNNSEIVAKVEDRQIFPGRRSVEEVLLNYSLNKSEGGGLFDRRRTAFNTYLLNEKKTDIVVSTEELLDAETNANYHDYRGLLIGVKSGEDSTYLVFINDYTIKNRLDPERLKRTLLALSQGMQLKMHAFFLSKIEP